MGTVDCDKEEQMSELVARTGRHQQRYEDGCRLVAGYPSPSISPPRDFHKKRKKTLIGCYFVVQLIE